MLLTTYDAWRSYHVADFQTTKLKVEINIRINWTSEDNNQRIRQKLIQWMTSHVVIDHEGLFRRWVAAVRIAYYEITKITWIHVANSKYVRQVWHPAISSTSATGRNKYVVLSLDAIKAVDGRTDSSGQERLYTTRTQGPGYLIERHWVQQSHAAIIRHYVFRNPTVLQQSPNDRSEWSGVLNVRDTFDRCYSTRLRWLLSCNH